MIPMLKPARRFICCTLAAVLVCSARPAAVASSGPSAFTAPAGATWHKLTTEPYRGKQDDIHFVDARIGFYVNGSGRIYRTVDGGDHWSEVLHQPGTYFRTIGMVDGQLGFAGNIGTEYFPGVTDTIPLYVTRDGGDHWAPVTGNGGPEVKGLCAIEVLRTHYVNAGQSAERVLVHAAGRVGGPAFLMRSLDAGATWKSIDMNAHIAMITDVKFFDEMNGMVLGADDANIERAHAVIASTRDGGVTWRRVYTSARPYELMWKVSFPTRQVGFATVQSYDPDTTVTRRVLAKTVDGGRTWQEIPLVDAFSVREFGVGFVDAQTGWVGTSTGGFETRDGGHSWQRVEMGRAVNKIRIVPEGRSYAAYAIGVEVFKFSTPAANPSGQ